MAFIPAVIAAVGSGLGAAASGIGAFAATSGGSALLSFGAQALLSKGTSQASGGGGSSYQAPNLPQIAPAVIPSETKAKAVAEESTKNKRKAISRNRTIFTDPLGLSDAQKSGTTLKTLTGV